MTPNQIPRRVLVVDDEVQVASRFKEALRTENWDVEICSSGDQVESKLSDFVPSVVVLDLRMPQKDGLDVLRDIERDHPWTRVVVVTGHGEEEDVIKCLNTGAYRYLKKPVGIDDLLNACEGALNDVPTVLWTLNSWYRALPDKDKMIFRTASGRRLSARELMKEITEQTELGREIVEQVLTVAVELIRTRLK
jgi:DNA-binding NtrC family response regulator